jgi:hypothetical protein
VNDLDKVTMAAADKLAAVTKQNEQLAMALAETRAQLAAAESKLAGGGELEPDRYWPEGDADRGFDCPDDIEIVEGLKVGDTYVLHEAYYFDATYRVTKAPDETNDDYEVERVDYIDVFTTPQASAGVKVPEGWKLVPLYPTETQCNAAIAETRKWPLGASCLDIYRAMLLAAPPTPIAQPADSEEGNSE